MSAGGSGHGVLKIESSSINISVVSPYFFPRSTITFSDSRSESAADVVAVVVDDAEDAVDNGT
jgi:hypothetical protein